MNARTLLPLVILPAILALPVTASAAETPAIPKQPVLNASQPDNDAQARARAALHADEVKATSPMKPVTQPPPTPSKPAVAKPSTKPAESVAPKVVVPTLSGPQPDNDAQAKAREALRQGAPTQPAPAMTQPIANTPEAMKPAASQPETAKVMEPKAAPEAKPSERGEMKPVAVPPAREKPQHAKGRSLTEGMQAPALPTTAQQQQALDALLQEYRADQISAAEYHTRRAKVLAGN